MANLKNEHNEILDFYDAGVEIARLNTGIGKIEFERSKEIILRCLGNERLTVFDVGGGTGEYSRWLAEMGHEVHLLELSPKNVEYAREINAGLKKPIHTIEVADALDLKRPDESADIVLLMGPLYHLVEKADRIKSLKEAKRVLKKQGMLIAAAISRYGSALWGLSVFGQKNNYIDDSAFLEMIDRELADGQHIRPPQYPSFIARAFFHLPGELKEEIASVGFRNEKIMSVEGPIWIVPAFEEKWADEDSRKKLLDISKKVESHENIMGMSPHLLAVAQK